MALLAKVKAVTSGDTLVLKSSKSNAEKTLMLAHVAAPRFRREGDEPHAFQSRDYLRKLVVDKDVQFTMQPTSNSGRDYGLVFLADGRSLLEVLVSEGQVRLRDDSHKGEKDALVEKLRVSEEQARNAGKGIWSTTDDGYIDARYDFPISAQSFLEEHKGNQITAIVERVISADRFLVRMIISPKLHQQLVILLAGIRAPLSTRMDANQMITPGDEYGDEAKDFVEARLLQRTVHVNLLGISPQGQLIGSVVHPAGNIAEHLLAQGYARCVDYHSGFLGTSMARLRDAEKYAKDKQLRLFKDHVQRRKETGSEFGAVVSRILSADTIFVRNKAGAERKLNLSSIRQPKPSDPSQAPFQADAKEFLRKKLIGKHVHVSIDGKRPAQDGYDERETATVTLGDQNIALLLVENGCASVVRHRKDDTDRSPIWDSLAAAEEVAKKEAKGMYSPKPPASAKMAEASESLQKAKTYLSFLQRQKRVSAIVDFVASGSRFKVIIPKENARLTFILSGIRCPRTARNAQERSEPFGPEALDFASKKCMQRDVEIDVEDIDRVGGFIGTMYVNRENMAKALVEEGLASVHAYSAEKMGHANELFAAENRAKAAHKGMWHDWTPEQDAAEQEDSTAGSVAKNEIVIERKKDYRDIVVSHSDILGNLKLQLIGPGTAALEELMQSFRAFHIQLANNKPLEGPPKAGQLVAARFTEDEVFYRAKVRHVDRAAKEAEVLYVDYGNSEKIPWNRMRPLAPQYSADRLKPQAVDAVWSFIKFPPDSLYAEDAFDLVANLTTNRQLVANVDHVKPDGSLMVTIFEPDSSVGGASINRELVAAGLAYVPSKMEPGLRNAYADVIADLEKTMHEAMNLHLGMWRYGDTRPDDE